MLVDYRRGGLLGGVGGFAGFKPTQLGQVRWRDLAVCPPQLPVASFFAITRTDMGRSYSPYALPQPQLCGYSIGHR